MIKVVYIVTQRTIPDTDIRISDTQHEGSCVFYHIWANLFPVCVNVCLTKVTFARLILPNHELYIDKKIRKITRSSGKRMVGNIITII